jgi:SAM-dependent methyltransferase
MVENAGELPAINAHWNRAGLGQTILDTLAASGKNLAGLTLEDLAPVDQFHGGGIPATRALAELAGLAPGVRVLDVGGGLGGPARTLAREFGCQVTMIDPAESYVQAAEMLTERTGLGGQVQHQVGNALDLPFADGAFDVVWTQQSGMNIRDKEELYRSFHRVLAPGGTLAFQEIMAGDIQPVIFPLMWANDASANFLRTQDEMRSLIESAGFRERAWGQLPTPPSLPDPELSIATIVMGDNLPAIRRSDARNRDEARLLAVRAVFQRL